MSEAVHSDSELIRLCLAGHRVAFDTLAARHYRGIYNVLYRMVGNSEDAADLTQETFVRVFTRLHTFRLDRSFVAWARAIASNLCIDHLRHRGAPAVSLDEESVGATFLSRPDGQSPADQLEAVEDSRRVLAAVQQLPEKQRVVLVLRHIEGLKLDEIAETLHMPLGTVKTMLFRGRETVRKIVGEL